MLIKKYLAKSKSCLIYPESYSSVQMKNAEQILEIFENMEIFTTMKEPMLEVRIENLNTVIIRPIGKNHVFSASFYPSTHRIEWTKTKEGTALKIKPKEKFKKETLPTLIIQKISP